MTPKPQANTLDEAKKKVDAIINRPMKSYIDKKGKEYVKPS
jgi:hypothetical protein